MKKANVLYVDDEESNLRTFKYSLRREYNVITANSAKEGLDKLAEIDVDVIVADQKMPEMTGVEFFKKVLKKYPMPNRILLTGYTDFGALKQAINEGKIFQYVQKPWEKEFLNHVIQRAIEAYRLEKDNKDLKEKLLQNNKLLKEEIETKNNTLRKLNLSQQELSKNEKRLREAEMLAGLGNWEHDYKTNQMHWSAGVYHLFNVKPGQIKPSPKMFSEIIYKDDREKDIEAYKKHLKNKEPYEIELRIQLHDETIKYVNKKCHTIFNNRGEHLFSHGTVQDITEKKLFEFELKIYQEELEEVIKKRTMELKEERDRAQNYLDIANVLFLIRDNDQNIRLINKKGLETLEYASEKDLIGLNWYDTFVTNDLREEYRQQFVNYTQKKSRFNPKEEYIIKTKLGKERLISWKNTLLKDHTGQITGMLSSGEDVTIRRENENKIKEYTEELEMFNQAMLGREMRIIELKEEINKLAKEINKEIPYPEIWDE